MRALPLFPIENLCMYPSFRLLQLPLSRIHFFALHSALTGITEHLLMLLPSYLGCALKSVAARYLPNLLAEPVNRTI
jgi:hypothetical protein